MRSQRKIVKFNEKQKQFLTDEFNKGVKTGKKEDPENICRRMRLMKDKDGRIQFSMSEFLIAQQIAGFFSIMSQKHRSTIQDEADIEAENAEQNICEEIANHLEPTK